jgi:hypothetical protein
VDTACSSSLVALDRAARSVRDGESELALVAGVNVILTAEPFISFSAASMLSREGRCRAFDASAQGFVRAEGGGVVVLKRLETPTRWRSRRRCSSHRRESDGRTGGMAAERGCAGNAAFDLRRRGNRAAGRLRGRTAPERRSATRSGRRWEAVLGRARPNGAPLVIGSVKTTSVTRSASGITSLLKATSWCKA